MSTINDVAGHTVGPSDRLDAHAETVCQGGEIVAWLHDVPRDPTERRPAVRRRRGTDIEGGRQVDFLAEIDERRAQTVNLHQHQGGNTVS